MTEAYKVEKVDLGMRLENRRVDVLIKVGWKSRTVTYSNVQSRAVTCSHVQSRAVTYSQV